MPPPHLRTAGVPRGPRGTRVPRSTIPCTTLAMHTLRALPFLAALHLLATPARAQLNTTVGPAVVPSGGELVVTFSNDTPGSFGVSLDWIRVSTVGGAVVYEDTTFEIAALMGPWGYTGFTWDLEDDQGQPVSPGFYRVEVKSDFGAASTFHVIQVADDAAGLVFEGTPTIHPTFGTSGPSDRTFYLQSPNDPGGLYFLFASFSSAIGVPTCGGTFPLDFDALLLDSLTPGAVFTNAFGVLDGQGRSRAPRFPLPPNPSFVGIDLEAAFVVLDVAQACPIVRISNAHAMTITG